jgi:hypothetical protein
MAKICILVLTFVVAALGQMSADLSAKFHHVTAYKVRPDVLMTVRFASDGQVCEVTLEKQQKTDTGIVLGETFSEKEVRNLVDDLVPEEGRGRNLTRVLNGTVDGSFITTEYTYENVLIRVYGLTRPAGAAGDRVIIVMWANRVVQRSAGGCTLVLSLGQ